MPRRGPIGGARADPDSSFLTEEHCNPLIHIAEKETCSGLGNQEAVPLAVADAAQAATGMARRTSQQTEALLMNFTTLSYLSYIVISIGITVLVARTLSHNGRIYLIDGFDGDDRLASSINHMLVVGFYLVNLGWVLLRMQTGMRIANFEQLIVYLASGLGFVLLVLGVIHFFNMYAIHKYGNAGSFRQRRARQQQSSEQPSDPVAVLLQDGVSA